MPIHPHLTVKYTSLSFEKNSAKDAISSAVLTIIPCIFIRSRSKHDFETIVVTAAAGVPIRTGKTLARSVSKPERTISVARYGHGKISDRPQFFGNFT